MNRRLYRKLAWIGMRKNKQIYYPYLLAGITMVMVFYILAFLGKSNIIHSIKGGETVTILFGYASWAVGMFSVPFLFYTNSALIKRRKKELGLYNILGMNKKNISFILFWEALITYGIVAFGGIFAGIVFSKAAELGVLTIMGQGVNYRVYVEWKAVLVTLMVFAVVFFLILLNMLRQLRNNNPIELLHSESAGERPPRSHGSLALISLVFIIVAYYLSITVETPLMGIRSSGFFRNCFLVVALLIAGTFLLFICASVSLCKLLQQNKKYYYKTSHFVTISSMTYRMKRNGAGLAVICILTTAIVVMLTFSLTFHMGSNNSLERQYPYDIAILVDIPPEKMADEITSGTYAANFRSSMERMKQDAGIQSTETTEIYSADMVALLAGGQLDLSVDMRETAEREIRGMELEIGDAQMVVVRVVTLEEYNRVCSASEVLGDDEVLIATKDVDSQINNVVLYHGQEVRVNKMARQVPEMVTTVKILGQKSDVNGIGQIFLVVSDIYSFMGEENGLSFYSEYNLMVYRWGCGMMIQEADSGLREICSESKLEEAWNKISEMTGAQDYFYYLKMEHEDKLYGLTGSLLFLMVIIDILFVFVAALIMYYKQISEGYEDQKRFAIMRKIGMTAKEIRKSVNSQILTVFWLPLLVAGIHLAFTLQIVYYFLSYAVLDNKPLVIKIMAVSYLIFSVVYFLVYVLTSRIYLNIVNKAEEE